MDTIKKCTIPLSYLNPQVKNPIGNVITDTLNWVPITGTYTADGTEKYLVLGNFISDANVDTVQISQALSPMIFTDVCYDDVSCIEKDVTAYAGPDKSILNGDSIYLGRERDFAVDPYCIWYQLPGMTPIDTTSGIYVKPSITSTYVVRQELECNTVKWDTVVVYVGYTDLVSSSGVENGMRVFPNPADDQLNISSDGVASRPSATASVYNQFGQLLKEEELFFADGKASMDTKDLANGVYVLQVRVPEGLEGTLRKVNRRFVVNR